MQAQQDQRRKIRVTGKESVVDVARAVFKDPRLATLIADLNPSLGGGALAANTVVTCPTRAEAAAFAKKMGFSLGFDEKAENGTRQKRAWAKLQGPGQPGRSGIDPLDAAKKLLEQKLAAGDVAKRLLKLCTPEALERFVGGDVGDGLQLITVQKAVRIHLDFPRAKGRLTSAQAVVDATLRPPGLLALLQALVIDGAGAQKLLAALLCPAGVRDVFVARAPAVVGLVGRARELARIERGARDATIAADVDGVALAALTAAVADGVAPVSAERLHALGLDESWALFSAHLLKLKDMLAKHVELLPRAGADIIGVLARADDGGRLARPWPVIASVVRGLREPLEKSPLAALDDGVGGLFIHRAKTDASGVVARPPFVAVATAAAPIVTEPMSMEGAAVVSAASLAARAASGARAVDEGTAIADRLASSVCALVELFRPVAGDTGPAPMRRSKRKAHFDDVVIARGAPIGDAVARVFDELFADARRTGFAGVDRVQRAQQLAARDVAKVSTAPITIYQKPVSEAARAIVVVAMTIDRDLGGLLLRPTGREVFRGAFEKHGGKALSKASLVFVEPPKA